MQAPARELSPIPAARPGFLVDLSPIRKVKAMGSMDYQPFPKTHWSLVRRAGGALATDEGARHAALAVLLERYQPALRSYLRVVRRMPAEAADDLLQDFIADKLLERELLLRADEKRGRFRTLLLTSLNRFAISRARRERTRSADALTAEVDDAGAPAPHAAVDAAWARALLQNVLQEMKRECQQTGRMDVWIVFEGRILADIFGRQPVMSYDELARRCRLVSPTQAANLLVTAKRMYARLLRAAVGEYELNVDDVEREIAELRQMVSAAPATGETLDAAAGDDA
jgi:DNA-directed RNA polymerase specialized sigma24 family protein